MIETYLSSYLEKAHYELIDNGARFYAEIKGLQGVWATGKNLEECRANLLSSLEGWFMIRLRKNLSLPNFKIPKIKSVRTMDYA